MRPHFHVPHVLRKRNSSTAQAHQRTLVSGRSGTGGGMSITRGLRWFVVLALLALLLSVAPASSHADTKPPPDPSRDRPSTVVVRVRGGFHWTDAGVGAAAMFATTLLTLGLVLAVGPRDRGGNGKP
jgi:hypothetical protein